MLVRTLALPPSFIIWCQSRLSVVVQGRVGARECRVFPLRFLGLARFHLRWLDWLWVALEPVGVAL